MAAGNELLGAYLSRYPDVARDPNFSRNPLEHFDQYGQAENRIWGIGDNALPYDQWTKAYLSANPDVAQSNFASDPVEHYQQFGLNEGRNWAAPQAQTPAEPTTPEPMVDPAKVGWTPGMDSNTDAGWDAYRQSAQQQTAGLNRMPFVFSDYAGISTDPAKAQGQMFYQTPEAVQDAVSPLFKALLGEGAAGSKPGQSNKPLSDDSAIADAEYRMMHPADPRQKAEAERRRKLQAQQGG
ncbi:hypothetical protein [Aurantimonas coralicida]|uniref:hypothetical protein n=1 Tax=Aurantimonas coralicida TaxID=182270 RepID=UPI001E3803CF|nr:hypothetical protein [Aurantimonas coralicida]MCD1644150.1 hypothetical protein [Aurantimonas coralicida]